MGVGPAFGMDANMVLAWHNYGGGKELLEEIWLQEPENGCGLQTLRPHADPAAGLVQENPWPRWRDLKGLKFRTVGLAVDVFNEMGLAMSTRCLR